MCGRFSLSTPGSALAEQLQLAEVPALAPRYNIAPTQEIAVVRQVNSDRILDLVRWGLIPSWATDPAIGARMINARAETVAEKPAFRAAFSRRRCLVLADGFYEWQRTNGQKQPFYFHLRDNKPFAFAGLWEQWQGADGTTIDTCALLTTSANEVLRPVHERMPVILHPDDYTLWLDPAMHERDVLLSLLTPYPAGEMAGYPVSSFVNKATNDTPQCVARAA